MLQDFDKSIQELESNLANQQFDSVRERLQSHFPSDIAYLISHIDRSFWEPLVHIITELPNLGELIQEMDQEFITDVIQFMDGSQVSELFAQMDVDNRAKVLSLLPEPVANWVFENLKAEDSKEAETLLEFEEGQAGRIMSLDFFSLPENVTVVEAFHALKSAFDAEMVYYIYITNDQQQLTGVVSIRDLLTKPNSKTMDEIMVREFISVPAQMDQEDVAHSVERYNLAAIPVVDEQNKILGIITVDDVIDVIRSEATEDIMKLAGTTEDEFSSQAPHKGFLRRMPWLLVSFVGGMLTIQTNIYFAGKIAQIELIAFITIIAGMGGNIGSQSSTIVVRGLATGKIHVTELWEVFFREIAIGVLLGVFFGLLLSLVASLQFQNFGVIGISVGMGMLFSMVIAAATGSFMPIIFQRMKVDPAVATGPFVSTTIDNLGLISYFAVTMLVMRFLN